MTDKKILALRLREIELMARTLETEAEYDDDWPNQNLFNSIRIDCKHWIGELIGDL